MFVNIAQVGEAGGFWAIYIFIIIIVLIGLTLFGYSLMCLIGLDADCKAYMKMLSMLTVRRWGRGRRSRKCRCPDRMLLLDCRLL